MAGPVAAGLLALFLTALVVPAHAWNQQIQTQVLRDALLLSPPSVQKLFEQSAGTISASLASIPTLTKNGRRDPAEHFATALRMAKDPHASPQRIVRELIALSAYAGDAVKPRANPMFFREVSLSKSLFVVEFDGYQEVGDYRRALSAAHLWSKDPRSVVERYAATGQGGLVAPASEAMAVLYNVTVNLTVDCWVSLIAQAGYPTDSRVVTGTLITPGTAPSAIRSRFELTRRVDFPARMAGFLSQVYGVREVAEKEVIDLEPEEVVAAPEPAVPEPEIVEQPEEEAAAIAAVSAVVQAASPPPAPAPSPVPRVPEPVTPPVGVEETVSLDTVEVPAARSAVPVEPPEPADRPSSEGEPRLAASPDAARVPATQPTAPAERPEPAPIAPAAPTPPPERPLSQGTQRLAAQTSQAPSPAPSPPPLPVPEPPDPSVVVINDDAVISENEVKQMAVDEEKIAPKKVEVDRYAGLSSELASVFASLELELGGESNIQESRGKDQSVARADVASRFDQAGIRAEQDDVRLESKEQTEVSMVFVLPQSESGFSGSLDSKEIGRVIAANVGGVKYCYERALRERPSLSGKVQVEFTIAEDGSVENALVKSSTLRAPAVDACILEKVRRLRFPPPVGGKVTVSYPFLFEQTIQF